MSEQTKQTDPWGKWRRVALVGEALASVERLGLAPDHVWANNLYEVWGYDSPSTPERPAMIWLSIKRYDRGVMRDWRDLQRIKNELVGDECEGCEIFPAESRLVDTSNQYHLWVFTDKRTRFPFGYQERAVVLPGNSVSCPLARQEPFGPTHVVPADALTPEQVDKMLGDSLSN